MTHSSKLRSAVITQKKCELLGTLSIKALEKKQNFRYTNVTISYHNHNRIFDLRAGAGASSTSVGPFPGNWLAARIADLTPDLQVLLS